MSLFNVRAFKAKQLTSKLAVAGLLASGLTVAPFFAGADGGYTVPAGVDVVQVVAVGGSGGTIGAVNSAGKGCELSASFVVEEGDVFSESLGGNGGNGSAGNTSTFTPGGAGGIGAEGRNGGKGADYNFLSTFRSSGSGGGGATSVYLNGTEVAISAGGGGGGSHEVYKGGSGCGNNTLDGAAGAIGLGGGGATGSAGGLGGAARAADGLPGQNGTLGLGGPGSDATNSGNGGSSGGGGGLYGGGSSPSMAGCCAVSGGGAGSSWAATPATGIKAATGKAATSLNASVTYYAVSFPAQTLSSAESGTAYSADLSATFKGVELSNAATALWTVSPALPAGLTLNASTGAITGTPTEQSSQDYVFKAAWKSGSDVVARSFQTIHLTVGAPPTTPGSPVLNAATAYLNTIVMTWTAPSRTGDSPISDYYLEYSTDGGTTWTRVVDEISTETGANLIGLQDYTSYKVRVLAVNNDGAGTPSNEITVSTLSTKPGAPTITNATVLNTNVTLEWNPPTHIGDSVISDYVIEYSSDGGSSWTTYNDGISTETTVTIRNLRQLTDFQFRVSAVNQSGTGLASSPYSATTGLGVPGQVVLSDTTVSNTGARIFWEAPDQGGAPITDYIIEYSLDGGITWLILEDGVGTLRYASLKNLGNSVDCMVKVAAVNELGTGDFSEVFQFKTGDLAPTPTASPTVEPTPTETATPTPTPTPTPTKTSSPKPTKKPTPSSSPSSSVTSEPTASPSATATPIPSSILDVLAAPYKHKGTIVELSPLDSVAFENGAPVPVKLIKKGTKDGYILDGSFFDLELAAADESGNPVQLDDSGNLVLQKDRYATFSGTGFAPNSPVQVWLFSTPTNLKRVVTDANGNFSGSALVPESVPTGEHTVQLNGVSEDGKLRSVALGVVVEKPTATDTTSGFDWATTAMWIVFALVVVALFWWLIVARRRRREEESV